MGRFDLPRPLPGSDDALTRGFYAHCARGELHFQRCGGCDAWRHLPRYMCAGCGSPEWRWERSTGRGRIFSWTVTHQSMHPAFAADVPYVTLIVEMDEGVRMVSGLRDHGGVALALELPVEVSFEPISDQMALTYFRVATPAEPQVSGRVSTRALS